MTYTDAPLVCTGCPTIKPMTVTFDEQWGRVEFHCDACGGNIILKRERWDVIADMWPDDMPLTSGGLQLAILAKPWERS